MSEILTQTVTAIGHIFTTTVSQSATPLLVVASYAGGSIVLYGLTRGKEFLIAGYSSLLFLAPFVHLS